MYEDIMVSVVVITYNHEKYIRQALDSILMQECNFGMEILVGDDCSKDSTPQILKEYRKKYPGIFRIILRKVNVGAAKNSYQLYKNTKGKYVAVLEGDDYWTDKYKLQKQVDFLENHPEYGGCCCDFHCVDQDGKDFSDFEENKIKRGLYDTPSCYTVNEYCQGMLPSQAATMVFRNVFKIIKDTSILYKAHRMIGDFTIVMFILSTGNIYRLPDYMAAYRKVKVSGDSWSAASDENVYAWSDIFLYHCNLENYNRNTFKLDINSRVFKSRLFHNFAFGWFKRTTMARTRYLLKMIRVTQDKRLYLTVLLQTAYLSTIPRVLLTKNIKEQAKAVSTDIAKKSWNNFEQNTTGMDVVLYGAGGGCEDFLDQYYGIINVRAIIDRDILKHGKYISGYKVCSKEILNEMDKKNTAIIITPGSGITDIEHMLNEMGFYNCYSYCYMELKKLRYLPYRLFLEKKEYLNPLT